jgi:hypothetical protein
VPFLTLGKNQALNQESGLMPFSKLRPPFPEEKGKRWTNSGRTASIAAF